MYINHFNSCLKKKQKKKENYIIICLLKLIHIL